MVSQQEARDDTHYVWLYEGSQWKQKVYALGALCAAISIVLFPLWPLVLRQGVWYLSMGCVGLLGLFLGLTVFRLVLYCLSVLVAPRGLWLYPNLLADVGVIDSFRPFWAWEEVCYCSSPASVNRSVFPYSSILTIFIWIDTGRAKGQTTGKTRKATAAQGAAGQCCRLHQLQNRCRYRYPRRPLWRLLLFSCETRSHADGETRNQGSQCRRQEGTCSQCRCTAREGRAQVRLWTTTDAQSVRGRRQLGSIISCFSRHFLCLCLVFFFVLLRALACLVSQGCLSCCMLCLPIFTVFLFFVFVSVMFASPISGACSPTRPPFDRRTCIEYNHSWQGFQLKWPHPRCSPLPSSFLIVTIH